MDLPANPARAFDLVVCDVDGCLGPETSEPLDVEALATVAEHNDRAYATGETPPVTLCTGRPLPYAEAICRTIRNRSMPLVAENGVWLYWPEDNRYDRDPGITPDHVAAVHAASDWLERTYGPRGVVQQPGKACSISLYHPDTGYLRSIEGEVRAGFERAGWGLRVSMTWLYINCDLSHVSKATALARLKRATGLARDRLAGIGDTLGDLTIRERVAWFACPANADERLKPHADYVSPHPEARGVIDILRRIEAGPNATRR